MLVQNLRPGSLEEMGLGPDTLLARHPRLIYCSVWAFGRSGPLKMKPGFEPMVQAFSGLMMMNGDEDGPPTRIGTSRLPARGATPSAFERRCIPSGCVAPPSNIPDILGRRALPDGRLAVLGATMQLHHGLLASWHPAASDSLAAFLEQTRTRIDEALERHLPRPPVCPAIVSEAMRYSLFAGGKRLRPTLTLAAADAVERCGAARPAGVEGSASDLAMPAACAVEMIHTYSLVHDDLPAMDNDTLRRGRPTLHVVYGDGIAVLAGDGLQAAAFALLAREPAGDHPALVGRKLSVVGIVADAAGPAGMVGGQAIDLQAVGQGQRGAAALDAEGLRTMHARKTGAMIRASAVAGAIMAGADESVVASVDRYGAEIGLAFQIVDDILDVEGSAQELGKTAGKDAAGAKPTYIALYGVARSRELATDCGASAREVLVDAGLDEGQLGAIADWIVSEKLKLNSPP